MTHHLSSRPAPVGAGADQRSRLLRGTLRLNGLVSSTSGLAMAAAPDAIDDLLGTGHPGWIRIVGVALIAFGVGVAGLSMRPAPDLRAVTPLIIVADVIWVAASVATIVLGWYDARGSVAVTAMALAVGGFAAGQFIGWRRLDAWGS